MSEEEKLHQRISKLAYKFYIMRGQKHGYTLQDWLNAERIEKGNRWQKVKIWFIVNGDFIKVVTSLISIIGIAGVILSFRASCISIGIAQKNLALTHNAVLFVQDCGINQNNGKTYICIKNSGKTGAINVRLGCYLLYFPDRNPTPEEKDHVSNPGKLIFYPEQIYQLPLSKTIEFNESGFYFLVVYIRYNTVDNAVKTYKGIFQHEVGTWLEVGINQKSIEIYKEGIEQHLEKLETSLK
jgi:hypothetical protein